MFITIKTFKITSSKSEQIVLLRRYHDKKLYPEEMRYKGGYLKVGNWESISKKITDDDIRKFSEISEDKNPLHLDDQFASNSMFKKRIAHGIISGSLISAVAGMKMPGPGSIYVKQTFNFRKPVFINDIVTATCKVIRIRPEKRLAFMETIVTNQNNECVIDGEAIVLVDKDKINPN